jgi:hypothetical protein
MRVALGVLSADEQNRRSREKWGTGRERKVPKARVLAKCADV